MSWPNEPALARELVVLQLKTRDGFRARQLHDLGSIEKRDGAAAQRIPMHPAPCLSSENNVILC